MTELFGASFSAETNTLSTLHNAGLFSNLSITLWAIIALFNDGIDPDRIDFSQGFHHYRDDLERGGPADLYPRLFRFGDRDELASLRLSSTRPLARPNHHGVYSGYRFDQLSVLLAAYFDLSDEVLAAKAAFVDRYRIVPEKTIAVVYRGTDKGTEVVLAEPDRYIQAAASLLARAPTCRVWIQTDQEQVRQAFHDVFGPRCFSLHEMPTTRGGRVLHEDPSVYPGARPLFAQNLVAVSSLLAECRSLVNHTGNMAAWITLFRGSINSTVQFDQFGHLWPSPDL